MKALKKVLLFGGTHGNEWTGIYVLKEFKKFFKEEFPQLDLDFIHANPEAFKINKRFKDEDLNRAFEHLHEDRKDSYENQRAREIKKLIEKEECFIIDLHTTTANLGNTLIISHKNPINLLVARYIQEGFKDTKVILAPDPLRKYLLSQSNYGLMIEVGPVANGIIDAKTLEDTKELINLTLKALLEIKSLEYKEIEVFEEVQDIFYPLNDKKEVMAYISRDFQNKDFSPIKGTYYPFKFFSGEGPPYKTSEELFPIFINEAAYYPSKLAYTLCRKLKMKI